MTDQTNQSGPVVLAYDGSEPAGAAIDAVAALMTEGPIVVATLWRSTAQVAPAARVALPPEVVRGGVEALDAAAEEAARKLAEQGAERARRAGLDAEPVTAVADPNVWSGFARLAEDRRARAVALGSRGLSRLKSALLGSVSMAVVQQAACPVLVVSHLTHSPQPEAPVFLCYDGSENARRAIEAAGGLLAPRPAVVAHWRDPVGVEALAGVPGEAGGATAVGQLVEQLDRQGADEATRLAEEGTQLARAAGFEADPLVLRAPDGAWRALSAEAARQPAAVLVAGARGQSAIGALLLGSVSHGLVQHSEAPVLIVPASR